MGSTLAFGLLLGAAALAWYAFACWIFPYRRCPHCSSGKVRSRGGGYWRYCRHCNGMGGKLRLGRRIWKSLH